MKLWGRALEKFTFSYSERIWDILQSSCINIQADKGIELILARFSKKIGNLKRIRWQKEGMRIEKHSYSEQEQNRPKKDVVHNVDIVARLAPLRVT